MIRLDRREQFHIIGPPVRGPGVLSIEHNPHGFCFSQSHWSPLMLGEPRTPNFNNKSSVFRGHKNEILLSFLQLIIHENYIRLSIVP